MLLVGAFISYFKNLNFFNKILNKSKFQLYHWFIPAAQLNIPEQTKTRGTADFSETVSTTFIPKHFDCF